MYSLRYQKVYGLLLDKRPGKQFPPAYSIELAHGALVGVSRFAVGTGPHQPISGGAVMREAVARFFAEYGPAFDRELDRQNKAYAVLSNALDFLSIFTASGNGLTALQTIELQQWLQEFESISGGAGDLDGVTKEQALNRLAHAYKTRKLTHA
jgi:hypothetical protein